MVLITDDVEAYNDVWILGDTFVRDCASMLNTIKRSNITLTTTMGQKASQVSPSLKYFLPQNFNIRVFYPGIGVRGINRFIYPLVDALNTHHRLPKYVIIAPDKDMMSIFLGSKMHTGIVMGSTIHFLIRQYEMYIHR